MTFRAVGPFAPGGALEGAFWIGSDHPFDLAECYLTFRRDIELAEPKGRFAIACDHRYRLWVNGVHIARGGCRSWPWAMAYDDHDISHALRVGLNRIEVQTYSPGYSHFAHVSRPACGWIGGMEGAPSDPRWRVSRDRSYAAEVPRVSIYGTGVEDRALPRDQGYAAPRILQPPEGPLWQGLHPRPLPLLREEVRGLTPWKVLPAPLPEGHGPASALHGQITRALSEPGAGRLTIYDLGVSQTVSPEVTIEGPGTLLISYAEKLAGDLPLISDPQTYCRMRVTDRYALSPGRNEVQPFTPRGARYLLLLSKAPPQVQVRTAHYPFDPISYPDQGALNPIAQTCRRTILTCLQDGFVDSIWRESSQWLGDVVPEALAFSAISDDPRPMKFALDMAAAGAAEDGILPSILPGDVPAYVVTDYNFSWVELLDLYLSHPKAEPDTLTRLAPVLHKMLGRFQQDLKDGLIHSQPGRRLFLDWSSMSRAEPNLTYNLRYLYALQIAHRLTGAWGAEAEALQQAIRTLGPDWRESPGGAPASQLALAFLSLTDTHHDPGAIIAASLGEAATRASPFMHHYVFAALQKAGRNDAIRQIIAKLWAPWGGLPTTQENWDISFPDGSACHGFSAHPLYWLKAAS
ncbi:hypothetical protein [Stagnihabitans tardus]|uniref:Alpha-L-rhamnosidase six-hairpin glycosidase domain-containing protein n=1 Tax=Stagnihabitans tardus TaxID=2699202 RepID=A0AAE5BVC0_9RHOB|nr:hypothetical protein [Stagnihabitans tardus]NBZ87078.1 hypothetical protein [Stagnihabitans tardus]